MVDVVMYEVFNEEEAMIRRFLSKKIRAQYFPETIQRLRHINPPARLISTRTQSRVPASWKVLIDGWLSRTQGFDHVVSYCNENHAVIKGGYLGGYCSRAVAEHAILMMMVLQKKFLKQIDQLKNFDRSGLTGNECQGKNALVVGVGRIGSQIVDMAKGLKLNVRGVDIVHRLRKLSYVPLRQGIAWADVIFCALPLTPRTQGLLNYRMMCATRKRPILINISRGEITPAADLSRLIKSKRLSGAGLDVYPDESLFAEYLRGGVQKAGNKVRAILDLTKLDNVLLTPHNAFNTKEALERKAWITARSVESFLRNKKFPYPVVVSAAR